MSNDNDNDSPTAVELELTKALKRLWKLSKTGSTKDMGGLFIEYVLESAHSSWEGYDPKSFLGSQRSSAI